MAVIFDDDDDPEASTGKVPQPKEKNNSILAFHADTPKFSAQFF